MILDQPPIVRCRNSSWKNSCVDGEMNGRLVRIRPLCYESFKLYLRVHYALEKYYSRMPSKNLSFIQ